MTRILLIEDNEDLAFGLSTALENEGFEVTIAADGADGLERATHDAVDLIILDLMLPKMDGYRVLRSLRGAGMDAPVLVLTAKGEEANKVQAFSIGGDDYVTKPFGVLELIARVRALLRRTRGKEAPPIPEVERFGEIEVNSISCWRWSGGAAQRRPARSCCARCGSTRPGSSRGRSTFTSPSCGASWSRIPPTRVTSGPSGRSATGWSGEPDKARTTRVPDLDPLLD